MKAPQSADKLVHFGSLSGLTNFVKQHPRTEYFVALKNLLGTGNNGVARVEYKDYFALYIMLCDKKEVNNWCVSGNIEGESVIPLQSMPCYEESITDSEFDNINTQLEQKFEDIGESLEDFSQEPRTFYAGANVTMVCEL